MFDLSFIGTRFVGIISLNTHNTKCLVNNLNKCTVNKVESQQFSRAVIDRFQFLIRP